ncbi:MAG: hypothetical protein Q8L68_00775 [Methylococcales bacterium]|nr:hypothetical protein [Methylococcales bacterium]
MSTTIDSYLEKENTRELELETLTKKYLLGQITIKEYKEKMSNLKARLDLRKAASRLKPLNNTEKLTV